MKTPRIILNLVENLNRQRLAPLLGAFALACGSTARAGTYTCDFTRGLDTNRWSLATSYPYDCYSNSIDSRGITFQRVADPPPPNSPRQNFGSFLILGSKGVSAITEGRGAIAGDFAMAVTYTNLNHFVCTSGSYGFWAVNVLKAWVQWGDGGEQRRILIGRTSSSQEWPGGLAWDFFRGFMNDDGSVAPNEFSITNGAPFGPTATLKIARTNGVLSYFVNDRLLGTNAPGFYTTNDINGVTLQLSQGNATEHVGVTFVSFSISGPSIRDSSEPGPSAPRITSAGGAEARVGEPFSYQISAENAPTEYQAAGLPAGLSLNTTSGLISGVPEEAGTFTVELSAGNASGAGAALLTLTIAPAESSAQSVVLQPGPGQNDGADDGSADRGKDASNVFSGSGASSPVLLLYNSPCNVGLWPGYIQFSTASLANQTVTKAEVQVYAKMWFNGSGHAWEAKPYQVSVRAVTAPWNELTLPAAVAPAPLSSNVVTAVGNGTRGFIEFEGWMSFDITELCRAWVNGARANHGLQFALDTPTCANGDDFMIYSSDYPEPELRPKLVVQTGLSGPALHIQREAGAIRLSWDSSDAAAWQIETSLTLRDWTNLGLPLTPQQGTGSLLVPMTNPAAFFRARVQ